MSNAKVLESVAALFLFEGEVLAVKRQSFLSAFPGFHSFPGGKIDKDESEIPFEVAFLKEHEAHKMRALRREMLEELGYDIEEGIQNGEISNFSFLAEALAPPFAMIRFRTWFYRVDLTVRPDFTVDSGEFADSFWKLPNALLDDYKAGQALMVPPTRKVLGGLVKEPSTQHLGNLSQQFDEDRNVPLMEMLEGFAYLVVKSATLPPASHTNAYWFGDEGSPKILVDPSPNSKDELQRLIHTLEGKRIDQIFLTHHHPDHHQFSPELAKHLKVPIILSLDSYSRLIEKNGVDFFNGVELWFIQEGEEVTKWQGSPVTVYEIPGHDAGHLGLAPKSMAWFIVGDLIQGIGTVVISEPEGNMATYFETLKRVIGLDPEIIAPSHGILMRSTHRLVETLKHRQEREQQILKLHQSGKNNTEILDNLYREVDPRLHPYAMKNIASHLAKLRQEQQIK